jgi:ketosteroid isomerase-like protein
MGHVSEGRFREAYAALEQGDLVPVEGLLAPDVVAHVPGRSSLSGDLEGVEQILGFLAALFDATGGTYRITARDVLANDDHVVVLEGHSCVLAGERHEGSGVTVYRMRDGQAAELWVHAGDPYGSDTFRELVAARM